MASGVRVRHPFEFLAPADSGTLRQPHWRSWNVGADCKVMQPPPPTCSSAVLHIFVFLIKPLEDAVHELSNLANFRFVFRSKGADSN